MTTPTILYQSESKLPVFGFRSNCNKLPQPSSKTSQPSKILAQTNKPSLANKTIKSPTTQPANQLLTSNKPQVNTEVKTTTTNPASKLHYGEPRLRSQNGAQNSSQSLTKRQLPAQQSPQKNIPSPLVKQGISKSAFDSNSGSPNQPSSRQVAVTSQPQRSHHKSELKVPAPSKLQLLGHKSNVKTATPLKPVMTSGQSNIKSPENSKLLIPSEQVDLKAIAAQSKLRRVNGTHRSKTGSPISNLKPQNSNNNNSSPSFKFLKSIPQRIPTSIPSAFNKDMQTSQISVLPQATKTKPGTAAKPSSPQSAKPLPEPQTQSTKTGPAPPAKPVKTIPVPQLTSLSHSVKTVPASQTSSLSELLGKASTKREPNLKQPDIRYPRVLECKVSLQSACPALRSSEPQTVATISHHIGPSYNVIESNSSAICSLVGITQNDTVHVEQVNSIPSCPVSDLPAVSLECVYLERASSANIDTYSSTKILQSQLNDIPSLVVADQATISSDDYPTLLPPTLEMCSKRKFLNSFVVEEPYMPISAEPTFMTHQTEKALDIQDESDVDISRRWSEPDLYPPHSSSNSISVPTSRLMMANRESKIATIVPSSHKSSPSTTTTSCLRIPIPSLSKSKPSRKKSAASSEITTPTSELKKIPSSRMSVLHRIAGKVNLAKTEAKKPTVNKSFAPSPVPALSQIPAKSMPMTQTFTQATQSNTKAPPVLAVVPPLQVTTGGTEMIPPSLELSVSTFTDENDSTGDRKTQLAAKLVYPLHKHSMADLIDGIWGVDEETPLQYRCCTPVPQYETPKQSLPSASTSISVSTSTSPVLPSRNLHAMNSTKKNKSEVKNRLRSNFTSALKFGLLPCPLNTPAVLETGNCAAISKVTVAVRCWSGSESSTSSSSYITIDSDKGKVRIRAPNGETNLAPSCRRQVTDLSRFFAFDRVFGTDKTQADVCVSTAWDVIQSVLKGNDGCIISYGPSKTGKSYSMIGNESPCSDFGVVPTSLSWLYQLVEQLKARSGSRFSIRVSALEISGRNEDLMDLLSPATTGADGVDAEPPKLVETAVYGSQLENLSEHRAADVEQAFMYLDSAVTAHRNKSEGRSVSSHFLFTLHIYQHHLETHPNSSSTPQIAGGRSRLHFIDIGTCAKSSSDGSSLTLAALGSIITALLNGQKHFPHKESKLATLLRDSVGSPTCTTCILVHVSPQPAHYTDTLQILQLAARIHRMKIRRRSKFASNSSDGSGSTDSKLRRRRGIKMGTSASLSDPDVSSSEQSIDTVIYVPDRTQYGITPNQSPSLHRAKQAGTREVYSNLSSPYDAPGAIKKRLSDEETSSEGRRRMPRTNARAWPKVQTPERIPEKQEPQLYPVDYHQPPVVGREEWVIPGISTSCPLADPAQLPLPSYVNQTCTGYSQTPLSHIPATHQQRIPPPWLQLTQPVESGTYTNSSVYPNPQTSTQLDHYSIPHYNTGTNTCLPYGHGLTLSHHPAQSGGGGYATPQIKKSQTAGDYIYPECHKQELWVDGPTEFTKSLRTLTSNLHKDDIMSPSHKSHLRHGEHDSKIEKSRHHRTPKRHRDASNPNNNESPRRHKQCSQCGVEIKKSQKQLPVRELQEEPVISVKPFVKDWVLKHCDSQNNSPTKTDSPLPEQGDISNRLTDLDTVDELQLTVELSCNSTGEQHSSALISMTDKLTAQSIEDLVDTCHADDSVSNITADERVGYESKTGSACDECSTADEMIEVCDVACQTEFTDTESNKSSQPISEKMISSYGSSEIRDQFDCDSLHRRLNNGSLSTLLRKPDGASDPSLHTETNNNSTTGCSESKCISSPPPSRKVTELTNQSNTLPRSIHLSSTNSKRDSLTEKMETVQIKPYLHDNSRLSKPRVNTLPHPTHSNKSLIADKSRNRTTDQQAVKSPSKLKKPAVFKSSANSLNGKNTDLSSAENSPPSSPHRKKGSKLLSLKIAPINRATEQNHSILRTSSHSPSQSPKRTPELHRKERKSSPHSAVLKRASSANAKTTAFPLPPPDVVESKLQQFDSAASPYRQYVLPRPSYATSDGCSDNSSCLSAAQARTKCSVSSGYESLAPDSIELDVSPTSQEKTTTNTANSMHTATPGPWLDKLSGKVDEAKTSTIEALEKRRKESLELSETMMRNTRIEELLYKQELLKQEMTEAKRRLMVPCSSWNFDSSRTSFDIPELHIASQKERRGEPGYVEALEKETNILQRRVDSCKSRIMLVTSIL